MSERVCRDCGRTGPIRAIDRCDRCWRRLSQDTAHHRCGGCDTVALLAPETKLCSQCTRSQRLAERRHRRCIACGLERRIAALDLCNRCYQRDEDRPFRYGAGLAGRLDDPPPWLEDFVAFAAARFSVHSAVDMTRQLGALLGSGATATPARLLVEAEGSTLHPTLEAFFVERHMALPGDIVNRRAAARRAARVAAVPEAFRVPVAEFSEVQVEAQRRARRLGLRSDADRTIERRLATLRDFSRFCEEERGHAGGWEVVTSSDVEAFLAPRRQRDSWEVTTLRQFLRWARRRRLVLVDSTKGLPLGAQPRFTGATLGIDEQRRLFQRWTTASLDVHPYECVVGLLALLHGASRIELASLVLDDIDRPRHAVQLGKRPHALVLDPDSWEALERAVAHHRRLRTLNPHLLVTAKTACRNVAARGQFVSEVLHPAGVVMRDLRSTRLSRLVSTYDPMLVAASFGLTPKTATYYLGDSVDGEHLQSTNDLLDDSP